MSVGVASEQEVGAFVHEVLLHEGIAELVAGTVPWLRDGVVAGEAVAVVASDAKLDALRDALGADARAVCFVDLGRVGRNPARIMPVWLDFVDEHRGRACRGISEPVLAGRSPAVLRECDLHEVLLGPAFRDGPAWRLLCPYDVSALDPVAIDMAQRSHPYVAAGLGVRRSRRYRDDPGDPFADPLPAPPPGARVIDFDGGHLSLLRRFVAGQAAVAGLAGRRIDDVVLAVSEVAVNSVRHGSGAGTLRVWVEGGALVCEVDDTGHPQWDPLVGRTCPSAEQPGGRGLWVVNQICDLVQISTADHRTTVRLHIEL